MQKQTEIPWEGGQDRWDENWKICSLYDAMRATTKVPEFRVPFRPVRAYRGSQVRRVAMPNVVARLVVLIFGLTLSFFLVHAGAAGISIPVHLTDAENYRPSPSPGRTSRPWWRAEPHSLDAR